MAGHVWPGGDSYTGVTRTCPGSTPNAGKVIPAGTTIPESVMRRATEPGRDEDQVLLEYFCGSRSAANSPVASSLPDRKQQLRAEREAEIAREEAREAERLRKIAEEKRRQEEFEAEKAEALTSLKGVSADDLGLKGGSPDDLGLKDADTGAAKGDNTSSFDLKDVPATPGALGQSETNRIYWRTVSVPAACVVAGELKAGDACFVVYHLLRVLRGPNAAREFEKSVLAEALKRAIVISLGQGQENLDRKIDLVKALYQAEAQAFDEIARRIDAEMAGDAAKQALLEKAARLDNEAVKALKQQIYAEKEANVQASIDYLRRNPSTKGIRFDCTRACQQLIQAAHGMNVLQ
jgi:hypothetical protein